MRMGLLTLAWALALGAVAGEVAWAETYRFEGQVIHVPPDMRHLFTLGNPIAGEFSIDRDPYSMVKLTSERHFFYDFHRVTLQAFERGHVELIHGSGQHILHYQSVVTLAAIEEGGEDVRPDHPLFGGLETGEVVWNHSQYWPALRILPTQRFLEEWGLLYSGPPLLPPQSDIDLYTGLELSFRGVSHLSPPLHRGEDGFYEMLPRDIPKLTRFSGPFEGKRFFEIPGSGRESEVTFAIQRLQIVPEPATWVIAGMTALSLFWLRAVQSHWLPTRRCS